MIHQELSGEMGLDLALLINFKNARLGMETDIAYARKRGATCQPDLHS